MKRYQQLLMSLLIIVSLSIPVVTASSQPILSADLLGLYDPKAEFKDNVADSEPARISFTIDSWKQRILCDIITSEGKTVSFSTEYEVVKSSDRRAYIIKEKDGHSGIIQLVQGNFYLDRVAEIILTNTETTESDIYFFSGIVSSAILNTLKAQLKKSEQIPTTHWLTTQGLMGKTRVESAGLKDDQGPLNHGYWWLYTVEHGWWLWWQKDQIYFTATLNDIGRIIEGSHDHPLVTIKDEWERYWNIWGGPYYANTPFVIGSPIYTEEFRIELLTEGNEGYQIGDYIEYAWLPSYSGGYQNWVLEALIKAVPWHWVGVVFKFVADWATSNLPSWITEYGKATRTIYRGIYCAAPGDYLQQSYTLRTYDNGISQSGDVIYSVKVYVKIPVWIQNPSFPGGWQPYGFAESPTEGSDVITDSIIHELR